MIKFHSIKSKIIITILLCFLVPFLFQATLVTISVNSLFKEKVIKAARTNLENSALNVSSALQAQFDMAWFYKNDQLIISGVEQLDTAGDKELTALQRSIVTRLVTENNVERYSYPFYYMIMDYKGNMMTNYTHSPYARYNEKYISFSQEEWFRKLKNSLTESTVMFSAPDMLNSYGPGRFYVATNVISDENIGILIIAVDIKAITAQLTSSLPKGTSYIVSENGDCIATSVNNTLDYSKEIFVKAKENQADIDVGKLVSANFGKNTQTDYTIMSHKITVKGYSQDWMLISVAPMAEVTRELTQIKYTNVMVLIFYILAIIWVIILLNRNIVKPILTIRNAVNEVTSGNLNVRTEALPNNELGELGKGFNSMVRSIDGFFRDITIREEQKRKTEIMLLQNQIKPHFVKNVLNTIRWLAEINGVTGVSKSIIALSGMLEYNFKDSETLSTVNDELIYVQKYAYLQKLRFQNKFKDEYDVQEDILALPMLKLSLQPIVENCIYHGVLNKEGLGTIKVTGKKQDDHLEIVVSDDGIGINPETQESLLKPKQDDVTEAANHSEKIALWNIDQRIKKQYGQGYGLTITSIPGQGTQVVIKFPVLEVTESND